MQRVDRNKFPCYSHALPVHLSSGPKLFEERLNKSIDVLSRFDKMGSHKQTATTARMVKMSQATERGYAVGQLFRMIDTEARGWEIGQIIRFVNDDGSSCPLFENTLTSDTRYVNLENITPADSNEGSSIMSNIQKQALDTFNTMRTRAIQHRNGEHVSDSLFYTGYGICDNISRCMPQNASSEIMALIKDNVIRRVPSYSGNYHYPVNCPTDTGSDAAENAWGRHSNKWADAYGALRLAQLEELIDIIENKWDDSLARTMTPATRVGIIPHVTMVQFRDGSFWNLDTDDGSSDPYFRPVGGGDRRSQELRHIKVMPMQTFENDSRSVAEFLQEIADNQRQQTEMQTAIAAMQKALTEKQSALAMLDYGLGIVHKVKRMDK
jgi:hypothetical protein